MKPNYQKIVEELVESGVRRGYFRSFKHCDDPTDEQTINTICDCVIEEFYNWFRFDDQE